MRNLWKRLKCLALGHRYVSDGVSWSMCYGCGRQICRPAPTSPDSETGEQ